MQPTAGIYALLNSELIRHRRLPLLEACFDRLVHALTKSLRTFTSGNAELSLVDTSSVRFGNYIEAVPQPALLSVFKTVEWNEYGLINIDSSLIYAIIDVLLGGRRSGASVQGSETRPFYHDRNDTDQAHDRADSRGDDQSLQAIDGSGVPLRADRIQSLASSRSLPPTNIAILFKIDVNLDDRVGRIEILIPYATLEPIRDLLQQMFMGEKFGQDSIWESHLVGQMHLTDVELDVTFGEQAVPLGEVLALEIGSTLKLRSKPQDPVLLRCGTTPSSSKPMLAGSATTWRSKSLAGLVARITPTPKMIVVVDEEHRRNRCRACPRARRLLIQILQSRCLLPMRGLGRRSL